jgi:hypothetical protein
LRDHGRADEAATNVIEVRFESLADITPCPLYFRFAPKSGLAEGLKRRTTRHFIGIPHRLWPTTGACRFILPNALAKLAARAIFALVSTPVSEQKWSNRYKAFQKSSVL